MKYQKKLWMAASPVSIGGGFLTLSITFLLLSAAVCAGGVVHFGRPIVVPIPAKMYFEHMLVHHVITFCCNATLLYPAIHWHRFADHLMQQEQVN